jgi:hypothetical protein
LGVTAPLALCRCVASLPSECCVVVVVSVILLLAAAGGVVLGAGWRLGALAAQPVQTRHGQALMC